ncbi:hypothetical protein QJQ45_012018 [Haematococcus lacustris]|nr:hypothetical protein QJQ45_012018 [Haematococcus lacustris]
MKRIGELCNWPDQAALPAKGKEYPGLGYKRVQAKPPKAQQQQSAVAHVALSDRARPAVPAAAHSQDVPAPFHELLVDK